MMHSLLIALLLVLALNGDAKAQLASPEGETSRWLPVDSLITLELTQPDALLAPLLSDRTSHEAQQLRAYQVFAGSPKFEELQKMIHFVEGTIETDWRSGLMQLFGGSLAFGLGPNEQTTLVVDVQQAETLNRIHTIAQQVASGDARKAGQPDRVKSWGEGEITRWSFNTNDAHAIIGRRLVAANSKETLENALERSQQAVRQSLFSTPHYQAARKAIGPDALGMAFFNLEQLRENPEFAAALQGQQDNPLLALLLAGITGGLNTSPWAALGFYLSGDTFSVRTYLPEAQEPGATPLALSSPTGKAGSALALLNVPRQIASLSLYRDLHRFYAAKDELFPQRTSGLIFFENMMGIFFTGRDLTEDVLAQTEPDVRLVVAEQRYPSGHPAPDPQLPAFAAVLRLKDPAAFDEVMEEAWQKAIGLVNFTRGQQAEPGLIIDRPQYAGMTFTTTRFSFVGSEESDNRNIRYNFRPSLAMPEDYVILSSTDQLARDLIDALQKEAKDPQPSLETTHSALRLDGPQLGSILTENRASLIRGNMVKEGHTEAEAELAIDTLLTLANRVRAINVDIGGALNTYATGIRIQFEPFN